MAECDSSSPYMETTDDNQRVIDNGHFKLTKYLGGGGYGKVYEAKNNQIEDGITYAVKLIQFFDSTAEKDRVTREVKALANLDHPNIVRYYQAWFEEKAMSSSNVENDSSSNTTFGSSMDRPGVQPSSNSADGSLVSNAVPVDYGYVEDDDSFISFEYCAGQGAIAREERRRAKPNTNAASIGEHTDELQSVAETDQGVECEDKSEGVARTTGKSREVADESLPPMSLEPRQAQSLRKLLLFIQMELCAKGTLKQYFLERPPAFDRCEALDIFRQTALAVQYIHGRDFIHRDLKPSNIFFAADRTVKIGDFGLVTTSLGWCSHDKNAGVADTSAETTCCISQYRKHTDDVGTELYMSPEQVKKCPYDNKVDIYALGLVFFELMYHFDTEMERSKTLKDVREQILPDKFKNDSPKESKFVKWLLEPDPTKRPSIKEICESEEFASLTSKTIGCSAEDSAEMALTCSFCQETLRSPQLVRSHLASRSHAERVASDDDISWAHRDPPCGITTADCKVCDRSRSGKDMCHFGTQCVQAHSDQELQEWKKRLEYRSEKTQRAKKEADALLKRAGPPDLAERMSELLDREDRSSVLDRKLEGVDIQPQTDLHVTKTCKKCEHCWDFKITTTLELRGVALTKNGEERQNSYFYIGSVPLDLGMTDSLSAASSGDKRREWNNCKQLTLNRTGDDDRFTYELKIMFKTLTFGSFCEYVAFSFGEPNDVAPSFVVRELRVDVEAADIPQNQTGFWQAEGSRWDTYDSPVTLVRFDTRSLDGPIAQARNERNYSSEICAVPDDRQLFSDGLKKENYKAVFHALLGAEQLDQDTAIARYNLCTKLRICSFYDAGTGEIRYCTNGELFAKAELGTLINDDSFEGRLLRQAVTCVYTAPLGDRSESERPSKAYEAIIEETGHKWILIRLSRPMVQECKLSDGMIANFQIQFAPSRESFNDLHWAVDALSSINIVYPDVDQVNRISVCSTISADRFGGLNKEQLKAISCINAPLDEQLPPILLLGPFGTGKTFTLAKAALHLASSDPDARLLLCTHSNSAADIYVRDYFDPEIRKFDVSGGGKPSNKLVRIYYANRRPNTVDPITRKYCLFSQDGYQSFRVPTVDDLQSSRFVVSTLMVSKYLCDIPLKKGFFTHIFIDEAAQAMEPEALMPLALATNRTRIVLAGDHMQMNPEICSPFAISHCLHISLIERLNDLYTMYATNSDCKTKIMLCENYRSHTDIVNFASKTFYGGNLKASGKQGCHAYLSPLCFFHVEGTDECSYGKGYLGYYNKNEVLEVAEVIEKVLRAWPIETWGEPCEEQIGVVAPYTEQVYRIRQELRKRRHDKVSVERIFNVQGKQFRVLVISTVRTTKTCSASDIGDSSISYAFLTDSKLFNTALTRAQSLVAVVGDAKSLCTVGRCRTIWNAFIETCSKSGSLNGITLNEIQGHLRGLDTERTKKNRNFEHSTAILQIPVAVTPPMIFIPDPTARSAILQNTLMSPLGGNLSYFPGATNNMAPYGTHIRMPVTSLNAPPPVANFIFPPQSYLQVAPLTTIPMQACNVFEQPVHGSSASTLPFNYVEYSHHVVHPAMTPFSAPPGFQLHNIPPHLLRAEDISRSSEISWPHCDRVTVSDNVSARTRMPQQLPEQHMLPPEVDAITAPTSFHPTPLLNLPNSAGPSPQPSFPLYQHLPPLSSYIYRTNTHQLQQMHPRGPTALSSAAWPSQYYSPTPPPAVRWPPHRNTAVNQHYSIGFVPPPPGFAPRVRDSQHLNDPARVPLRPPNQPRTWTGDTPAEAPIRPTAINYLENNNPHALSSVSEQRPRVRPSTPPHQSHVQQNRLTPPGAKSRPFKKGQ